MMRFTEIELIGAGEDCEKCEKLCLCNLPDRKNRPSILKDRGRTCICQEINDVFECPMGIQKEEPVLSLSAS
jgi:hypothetical protein